MVTDCANRQSLSACLPRGWASRRLDDIAPLATGGTPSTRVHGNFGDDFPFVSPGDIADGKYVCATARRLSKTGFKQCRAFPKGSILFVSIGSTIGKCAVAAELLTANQQINAVLPSEAVASDFLYYALCARGATIRAQAGEQAVPIVNKSQFGATFISFPIGKDEQRRIGNALSDADALIDSLEQLLTKKRQIKQGAMQELLTGKRRLPGFNDPWIPRSMADLFNFSGGLSASRDQLGDIGPCYLHYGDIHLSHKTYIDLDAEHHQMPRLDVDLRKVSSSALLRNGDVVFVDASEDDQGVSKHVVVHSRDVQPLISGLHTIVARPKSDELVDLYKRYCFQAPPVQAQFRFYAVGTKVSGVSKGNIGKIMLNVPLPVEQKEIAACLGEMDAEIYALESRLTKARALKQAMAQALLTGRIRLVEPAA